MVRWMRYEEEEEAHGERERSATDNAPAPRLRPNPNPAPLASTPPHVTYAEQITSPAVDATVPGTREYVLVPAGNLHDRFVPGGDRRRVVASADADASAHTADTATTDTTTDTGHVDQMEGANFTRVPVALAELPRAITTGADRRREHTPVVGQSDHVLRAARDRLDPVLLVANGVCGGWGGVGVGGELVQLSQFVVFVSQAQV